MNCAFHTYFFICKTFMTSKNNSLYNSHIIIKNVRFILLDDFNLRTLFLKKFTTIQNVRFKNLFFMDNFKVVIMFNIF